MEERQEIEERLAGAAATIRDLQAQLAAFERRLASVETPRWLTTKEASVHVRIPYDTFRKLDLKDWGGIQETAGGPWVFERRRLDERRAQGGAERRM